MDEIKEISLDLIDEPTLAMRSEVHDEDIDDLAQSIKVDGLQNPIVVRPVGDRFEIVSGHRRFLAHRLLGKVKILCQIKSVDENQALVLRIQENTHRLDVNPVDDAVYIGEVMNRLGCSVKEMAKIVHRSESFIYQRLAILDLPDYMFEFIADDRISVAAALALNEIENEDRLHDLVMIAVQDGVSAATASRWAQMEKLNQLPQDITSEGLKEVGGQPGAGDTKIVCAKCNSGGMIKEMEQVWIHRGCPQ